MRIVSFTERGKHTGNKEEGGKKCRTIYRSNVWLLCTLHEIAVFGSIIRIWKLHWVEITEFPPMPNSPSNSEEGSNWNVVIYTAG